MLKDIKAVDRWHTVKRITIPDELSDAVATEPKERENAIKQLMLRGGRVTSFGSVPYRALLTFCGSSWLDDNCMGHGIALLHCEHPDVGVVNPLFLRFQLREQQLTTVKAGNPFAKTNKIVLIPLHIDNNHWCGAVIDFRRETRIITLFDPLQASKSKYCDICEAQLKSIFGEICTLLTIKRETRSRQPDGSSCGVAVLMFFECFLRGIPLPAKPTLPLIRFLRLRYMLQCLM
ncbi:cysteine protease family C48, putative [Phytophthora infestans T30-4]|uniref:Cysteine protease family C48, putative n=1 Tax=Phytophthora infestans (strain T30-4) TaxID=403677 RepID=D0P3Z7_PHYIT|nr:cysteine protease family C48, putative [Phytophthora infestans T30-4]EEY62342.1 cysteine protease family C48, putative [Phytophthora infestans T30-4]|eukprot:XP_002894976.1 cysteine protease family C48, putative [Phytophthora infestans T30-4]